MSRRAVPEATSPPSTEPAPLEAEGPDVPPIACEALLELSEIDSALGVELADFSQSEMRGERCRTDLPEYPGRWIQIEPGDPADFAGGTSIFGTEGLRIEGIGDAAVWFAGEDSEEDSLVGLLAVYKDTNLGALLFRIRLARPDVSDEVLLEAATGAALAALARFPGVGVEPEEAVVVVVDPESPDRSHLGYVDNLLEKVGDDEWSLEEGLIATLRLFGGDLAPEEVLREPDLLSYESRGIREVALHYLQHGSDGQAKQQIEDLLDALTFSNEELERMAGIGPATVSASALDSSRWVQEAVEDCERLIGKTQGVSECLEVSFEEINGKIYRVFKPAPSLEGHGWTQDHYDLATLAIQESVPKLDMIGTTPATNLVFSVAGNRFASSKQGDPCGIFVYTDLQDSAKFPPGDFKQVMAHELGHCFNGSTFPDQAQAGGSASLWWEEGVADYWSNYVYPSNKLEWRTLGTLAQSEQATTLFDRTYANAIFFQYLEKPLGQVDGIKSVISHLPGPSGPVGMAQSMASFPGMADTYHDFARTMANTRVIDTSGVVVPYVPVGWELDLSGPTEVPLSVPVFGVRRLHITVPDGMYACFDSFQEGELQVSWRDGDLGEAGEWRSSQASPLQGETVLVVTAVKDGAKFTLNVREVAEGRDCQDRSRPQSDQSVADACLDICRPSLFYKEHEVISIVEDISGN